MTHDQILDLQRGANADAAFEAHLFDRGSNPEEADGWERRTGSNEWTRAVYFPNTEDEDGPTVRGHYTVVFENNSAEIKTSYASINGNDVGERVPVRVFLIDENLPKLPADYERLSHQDVLAILPGLQEIAWLDQDNDAERWSLTAAGQFLRQTTKELDRYYVVPVDEAKEALSDLVEPSTMEQLEAAGAFKALEVPAP